ncbi:MAG: hypothetical protein ACHQ1G_01430, partial [Planctomycetota bacterium]
VEMRTAIMLAGAALLVTCAVVPHPPPDPHEQLVERGREIFFNETFGGNGRTCGTCHPAQNNFTIDAAFIATLPPKDPLFVAEFVPALKKGFENPELMRKFGLILENLDGFEEDGFVMRGVPHTLGMRNTIASPDGPRTGWSGDGSPGDGSLRSFATGAVIQHFTKRLDRVAGVDFRLPTDEELDALEAFQLSLGRQEELALPLKLKGEVPRRGQEIFLDDSLGKCNLCHSNAGANANIGGTSLGNANFNTGVENLPDQPPDLTGTKPPPDDGFDTPGDGTFNTPSLIEAANTGPFFHNNAIDTIEGAVAFYNGDAFNNSPSGAFLKGLDPNGVGIRLDATQVVEVAAFLRVLNALEDMRESQAELEESLEAKAKDAAEALEEAADEIEDAARVLENGGLHPDAVKHLHEASRLAEKALRRDRRKNTERALRELDLARGTIVG